LSIRNSRDAAAAEPHATDGEPAIACGAGDDADCINPTATAPSATAPIAAAP